MKNGYPKSLFFALFKRHNAACNCNVYACNKSFWNHETFVRFEQESTSSFVNEKYFRTCGMLFKHSSFQLVVNFFVALLRSIVSMNAHNLWDFTCLNAHPTPYLLRGQFFTRARQATYFKKKEIKTLTGSCIHYELIRIKNHRKIGSCFITRSVFPFCVVEKILWKLFANIFDIAEP